jgi:hypothetical protein
LSLLFNQEEARASQEEQQEEGTVGLRVFVDLYHNGRGSAQLCVYSSDQNLGCKTLSLRQYSSPIRVEGTSGVKINKDIRAVKPIVFIHGRHVNY